MKIDGKKISKVDMWCSWLRYQNVIIWKKLFIYILSRLIWDRLWLFLILDNFNMRIVIFILIIERMEKLSTFVYFDKSSELCQIMHFYPVYKCRNQLHLHSTFVFLKQSTYLNSVKNYLYGLFELFTICTIRTYLKQHLYSSILCSSWCTNKLQYINLLTF